MKLHEWNRVEVSSTDASESNPAEMCGLPEAVINYPWNLDWRYMLPYLVEVLGEGAIVWLDLVSLSQHLLQKGDLTELIQVPEVINWTGRVSLIDDSTHTSES